MKHTTIYVDFKAKKVTNRIVSEDNVIPVTNIKVYCCAKVEPNLRNYWCADCKDGKYDKCFYRAFGSDNML